MVLISSNPNMSMNDPPNFWWQNITKPVRIGSNNQTVRLMYLACGYDVDLPAQLRFQPSAHMFKVISFAILFLLSVAGNSVLFVVLSRSLLRRSDRVQRLLWHMNIADLIITLYHIPKELIHTVTIKFYGQIWLCKICKYMDVFGVYLGSNILVVITVDRFCCIMFDSVYLQQANRRVNQAIIASWITASVLSLPQLHLFTMTTHPCYRAFSQCIARSFFDRSTPVWMDLFNTVITSFEVYILPFIVICICYAFMFIKISRHSEGIADFDSEISNIHEGYSFSCWLGREIYPLEVSRQECFSNFVFFPYFPLSKSLSLERLDIFSKALPNFFCFVTSVRSDEKLLYRISPCPYPSAKVYSADEQLTTAVLSTHDRRKPTSHHLHPHHLNNHNQHSPAAVNIVQRSTSNPDSLTWTATAKRAKWGKTFARRSSFVQAKKSSSPYLQSLEPPPIAGGDAATKTTTIFTGEGFSPIEATAINYQSQMTTIVSAAAPTTLPCTSTMTKKHPKRAATRDKQKGQNFHMTAAMVILFLVCWTPYFISAFLHFLDLNFETGKPLGNIKIPPTISTILNILATINSCANPYLYGYFSIKLRREVRRVVNTMLSEPSHLASSIIVSITKAHSAAATTAAANNRSGGQRTVAAAEAANIQNHHSLPTSKSADDGYGSIQELPVVHQRVRGKSTDGSRQHMTVVSSTNKRMRPPFTKAQTMAHHNCIQQQNCLDSSTNDDVSQDVAVVDTTAGSPIVSTLQSYHFSDRKRRK